MMVQWLVAIAIAHPSLDGLWTLDRAASEDADPLLAAMGAGWLERQLLRTTTPSHEIQLTDDGGTIVVRSGPYRRTDELHFDGQRREVDYPLVGKAVVWHRSDETGVTTWAQLPLRDGTVAVLRSTRSRITDQSMLLHMVLTLHDGRTLSAKRYFVADH